jgi:hypothetical protein
VTLNALMTIKYHGQNRERSPAMLCDADIVITTYHTLSCELSSSNNLINDIEWYRLVLDEGICYLSSRNNVALIDFQLTSFGVNPPDYIVLFPVLLPDPAGV